MREIKFRAWDKIGKKISSSFSLDHRGFVPFTTSSGWTVEDIRYQPGRFILMQYTGIKDGMGKEIAEGDILKGKFSGVVTWTNETACYNNGWSDFWKDSEIIGNIYENPELLSTKSPTT